MDTRQRGIHLYKKEFYNRDKTYPLLGIDTFITEEDVANPAYYGDYISDMEILNELKNTLESQEKSFVSITTMGTHSPYIDHYFEIYKSYINNEKLSVFEKETINNYTQALVELDRMIGGLVEYINSSSESTLLIMYGDHYPLMYDVYEALEIIEKNENNISIDKYPELFKMPYVVYSNKNKIEVHENIVASDFCKYILENVKLKDIPWYYNVIYDYANSKQNYDDYRLIQYDEIFGKRFWKKYD